MRAEVLITITVGALIISTLDAIRLTLPLVLILVGTYLVFGCVNYTMLIGEMEILMSGINQLHEMGRSSVELSKMGEWLASQAEAPGASLIIPALQTAYWLVTMAAIAYAFWKYASNSRNPTEARRVGDGR